MNNIKIKIVIVGAGNVATHFADILNKKGLDIIQIYSRTIESAQSLASKIGCNYTCKTSDISPDGDLYIVSLKDDALGAVLPQLASKNKDAIYVHTAGSVPMDIWKNIASRYGVVYPMQTFSKTKAVDFNELPIFIEANTQTDANYLMQLFSNISNKVRFASTEQRKYLHLAAVFACNFSNHMYTLCHEILKAHDLPFDSMTPLIDETAQKVHVLSPLEAQTGPARRNDENIMQAHMELLKDSAELSKMYDIMSKSIIQHSNKCNQ